MELKIVENKCPYCGDVLVMNKRSFANHVRWCKSNPKYSEILESTISKISGTKVERKEHIIKCEFCGKEFSVFCTDKEFKRGYYNKTCSTLCSKRLTVKKGGEGRKKKIAMALRAKKAKFEKEYSEIDGLYTKRCECCGNEFKTKRCHQVFCSRSCAAKARKRNSDKTKFSLYKSQCKFLFALNEYPNEFDFFLIEENGWYKATNHGDNLNGVSRDHMYSISEGYKNGIDPYFISHPANCKLLLQTENASKNAKCSITEDELMCRVVEWEKRNKRYENKIDYFGIEEYKTIRGV